MKEIVTALVVKVFACLLGGLFLMLAVGVARAHWLPELPTLGYWIACLLVLLLRLAFASEREEA